MPLSNHLSADGAAMHEWAFIGKTSAMVRKKTEGNEDERRAAAREARQAGTAPSAEQVTTGASKQRRHVGDGAPHEERVAGRHRGKQEWRKGDDAEADIDFGVQESVDYGERGRQPYTEDHETAYRALAAAMERHDGEAVHLDEVAATAELPADRTRDLLHDLAAVHHVVTVLEGVDDPDLGPRYETSPGR